MTTRRTVLLVDADPGLQNTVEISLGDEEYDVIDAADAEAALGELDRNTLAVAIIDMTLHRTDGVELCGQVRRRGIPIVAIDAVIDSGDAVAILDAGADAYMTRPIDGRELLARVRAVVRRAGGAYHSI